MQNGLVERERAFESEFAYQGERAFRQSVEAIGALAKWAAAEMDLTPESAAAYVRHSTDLALEADALNRLTSRVLADLKASGIEMTEGRLRLKYQRFFAQAQRATPTAVTA